MKSVEILIQDMIHAIRTIQEFQIPDYSSFLEDEKTQDAVMYNLIILGEAANRIPPEYQDAHPAIPWTSIIGTRNVIVHGYDQIKLQIVWDIVSKNLNDLKRLLEELL